MRVLFPSFFLSLLRKLLLQLDFVFFVFHTFPFPIFPLLSYDFQFFAHDVVLHAFGFLLLAPGPVFFLLGILLPHNIILPPLQFLLPQGNLFLSPSEALLPLAKLVPIVLPQV
jgi:hypothetical protein